MKTASKTSSGSQVRKRPALVIENPYRSRRNRGRKREARRWSDVLAARTTNGARNPNPSTIAESARLHARALADLEAEDAVLWRTVHEIWWDESAVDVRLTLEEWKVRARRRAKRWNKIRESLRR